MIDECSFNSIGGRILTVGNRVYRAECKKEQEEIEYEYLSKNEHII